MQPTRKIADALAPDFLRCSHVLEARAGVILLNYLIESSQIESADEIVVIDNQWRREKVLEVHLFVEEREREKNI